MSIAIAPHAETDPEGLALADERATINWRELDRLLDNITGRLLAAGLEPGERVAVLAPNCVEAAVAYLAAASAGISSVPINFHLTADEVAYILTTSQSRILFVSPETAIVGRDAAAKAGIDLVVAWRTDTVAGLTPWENWTNESPSAPPPSDMAPRRHLHFTSGTTGKPKGTETPPSEFPKGETVAEMFETVRTQFAASPSPIMIASPLYHTGPVNTVRKLAAGVALVILSRFDAEDVLKAIDRYKVEMTSLVPTHFQRMLALPQDVKDRYDVSSMTALWHTGAACPRDVKEQMIAWFGPVLIEAYGATEAGAVSMITSPEWLQRPGSVGRALPPFEILSIGEDGSHQGPNEVGGLYFRDTTGRGIIYHDDPEKTAAAHIEPGVFTLGEVGYYDEEGYIFITDRTSDMIVSGGVNIYPAEAEQVLILHEAVADVAVVGAPNAEMGEEVKAIIVPHDIDNPPSFDTLNSFCRAHLAGYKCPRSYEFVSDIGRNAMGKINKRELRRRFWPTDRTIGG